MDTITIFPQIAIRIIREQENVIGPLAWDEAKKVKGMMVNMEAKTISYSGDGKAIINSLVAQYERIFGKASHAVCHDAVQDLIAEMPPSEVPESLK